MKKRIALVSALFLIAFSIPASAHPGHESSESGYLVFWKGILPKAGASLKINAAAPDFWRNAFVSKYSIVGAQLPSLAP